MMKIIIILLLLTVTIVVNGSGVSVQCDGEDGFCTADSDDVLWDGKDCWTQEEDCCKHPNLPWFSKTLPEPTSDYIELRVCCDQESSNEDVPVSYYEIYVK